MNPSNTPVLEAVSEMLLGALDDGPGSSDLTPPVGAVLAAVGPGAKPEREARIRDKTNPWVCSVLFDGDAAPKFLVGNARSSSGGPLEFTSDPTAAMTAERSSWFEFCWPYLIWSHGSAIGKKVRAVVHRLNDAPKFA